MKTFKKVIQKLSLTLVSLIIVFFLILTESCKNNNYLSIDSDPILAIAHGEIIGLDGNTIDPKADFILAAQEHYIQTTWDSLKKVSPSLGLEIKNAIYNAVDDKTLANALFLDWLLEKVQPKNVAHLTVTNNALRWYYVKNIQKDPILPEGDKEWAKGIEANIAIELENKGIKMYLPVSSGGVQYRQDCIDAGVPIPDQVFSDEWEVMGAIENKIVMSNRRRVLKMYVSNDPKGFCLSLSSYEVEQGSSQGHLDVICFGTQTNNACFFEEEMNLDVVTDFSELGTPFGGSIGVCTSCHAGENAFIVHPKDTAFINAAELKGEFFGTGKNLMGTGWYKAIVPTNWPKNPGPMTILETVPVGPNGKKCTICHSAIGPGGRFPDMSDSDLSFYCNIFDHTIGTYSNFEATMPLDDLSNIGKYLNDINFIRAECGINSDTGIEGDVDLPNDRSFVSPPTIIEPLYQCATQIAVRGSHLNADVALFINNIESATIGAARNPDELTFTGLTPLLAGDEIKVRQRKEGSWSDFSPIGIVRNHKKDYPNGIPAPFIDPNIIYECASVIAVRHVPGVKLTVFVNGDNSRTIQTSTGWTQITPGKFPFEIGDKFTVEASLCDEMSPLSSEVEAIAAPTSFPPTHILPVTNGQEIVRIEDLIPGALVTLEIAGIGEVGSFSSATSTKNFVLASPLNSGDQLNATQKLCDINLRIKNSTGMECNSLAAPHIKVPIDGENFVIPISFVLGATIRINDASGVELGDGIGSPVMLNRALVAGELISVVQQLDNCTSQLGYFIMVSI